MSVGAVLPYLPLLSFRRIYVTDDVFTSDIFNGELPVRVLTGRLLAHGKLPTWTSEMCSGTPLASVEPISLGAFAALPPAAALSVLVLGMILVAAHGAYSLARRFGAQRSGAALAGISFAGSGAIVTQIKHLSILSTVVWLPWGLLLLDRALADTAPPSLEGEHANAAPATTLERFRDIALFGLVFAEQAAAGFPQSAYICALVYGVFSLWLLVGLGRASGRWRLAAQLAGALAVAVALGGLAGAPVLVPLRELATTSDRSGGVSWAFASMRPYSSRDMLNFLVPYANGDAANGTYSLPGVFWENYGYAGLATFLLAIWALVRAPRRPRVILLVVIIVGAYSMVLGPNTPAFHLAWRFVPGMNLFRFPTRFLFVVDLGLALLAALGLGLLRADLERKLRARAPRGASLLVAALVAGTALDLFAVQSRQNPFVPAAVWLAPPQAVTILGDRARDARFFTPAHRYFHIVASRMAHGWRDLRPFLHLRQTLAPNTGLYWGVTSVDCYGGLAPSWWLDVFGDSNRPGYVMDGAVGAGRGEIAIAQTFARVLRTYGVTHVVSPVELPVSGLTRIPEATSVYLYEVGGQRARVVPRSQVISDSEQAAALIIGGDFDPDRTVLLAWPDVDRTDNPSDDPPTSQARVTQDTGEDVTVQISGPGSGYLVLTDTWYPGWTAEVDGRPAPILRANITSRAVRLPPGAKRVTFRYAASPFRRGLTMAAVAVPLLVLAAAALSLARLRELRRTRTPPSPLAPSSTSQPTAASADADRSPAA